MAERADDEHRSWIVAFDKSSGRERWRIHPDDMYGCYATPLVYRRDSRAYLLVLSWEKLSAYDVESGELTWVKEIPLQEVVASMARAGPLLALGGGTSGPRAVLMFRLGSGDQSESPKLLWKSVRGVPETSSPVFYGDRLFAVGTSGLLTCFDASSGGILNSLSRSAATSATVVRPSQRRHTSAEVGFRQCAL